jgi:TM2 domain-containing membrane protein YozV
MNGAYLRAARRGSFRRIAGLEARALVDRRLERRRDHGQWSPEERVMEQQQFEEAVQRMLGSGAERLTPGDVAFRLHLPVKDTERSLDRMVTEGKLELDSDDAGNLFYFKPGSAAGGVFTGSNELGPAPQPLHPDPSVAPPPSWQRPTQAMPAAQPGWPQPPGVPPQVPPGYAPNPYGAPPPGYPPNPYAPQPQAYAPNPYAPTGYAPNPYAPPPQPYAPNPYAPTGYAPNAPYPNPYAQPPGYPQQAYAQPAWPGQVAPNAALQPYSTLPERKSPGAAAALSFFIPGAGQLYNGNVGKGMAVFFGMVFTAATVIGLPLAMMIYFYGIADAYNEARRMNARAMLPP